MDVGKGAKLSNDTLLEYIGLLEPLGWARWSMWSSSSSSQVPRNLNPLGLAGTKGNRARTPFMLSALGGGHLTYSPTFSPRERRFLSSFLRLQSMRLFADFGAFRLLTAT